MRSSAEQLETEAHTDTGTQRVQIVMKLNSEIGRVIWLSQENNAFETGQMTNGNIKIACKRTDWLIEYYSIKKPLIC